MDKDLHLTLGLLMGIREVRALDDTEEVKDALVAMEHGLDDLGGAIYMGADQGVWAQPTSPKGDVWMDDFMVLGALQALLSKGGVPFSE